MQDIHGGIDAALEIGRRASKIVEQYGSFQDVARIAGDEPRLLEDKRKEAEVGRDDP